MNKIKALSEIESLPDSVPSVVPSLLIARLLLKSSALKG
jgi:hypothetical protein